MKLGLGSAQFGLDYGISNDAGQTPVNEVSHILQEAEEQNTIVNLIDTAPVYGNSESILGKAITSDSFKLVTKTPQFNAAVINKSHANQLKETFLTSLDKLNTNTTYGLLVHNIDDLFSKGGEHLIKAIVDLKTQGLVNKIGVSAYTANQIKQVTSLFEIDLIQLPLSAFDQRLELDGTLKKLKDKGVEIHVRSIFLQGLLLTEMQNIKSYFKEFKPHIQRYQETIKDNGMSLLQGALAYIASIGEVDYALVGATSRKELIEILSALKTLPKELPNFYDFHSMNERLIDPLIWLKEGARN